MSPQSHLPFSSSSLVNSYQNGQLSNPKTVQKPIPFERIDTHSIKQQLHDVLGEDGLPYWKALNGYLLGQIGRGELEGMVKSWFKGDKLDLHNTLLLSLLNNASIPPTLYTPITASSSKKRKRVGYDDVEFDIDEEHIEPKLRVQNWIMGINGRERARIRRSVLGKNANNAEEEVEIDENISNKRAGGWGTIQQNTHSTPLALPSRHLPSSTQLSLRLSQYAKIHGLTLAPDSSHEIGEFLAVGLDNHLEDMLHSVVHLTASNRPGIGTVHIPSKKSSQDSKDIKANEGNNQNDDIGKIPKADLNGINHLMILNPNLHPQISPALYKLQSGQIHPTESPTTLKDSNTSSTELNGKLSEEFTPLPTPNGLGYGQSPYENYKRIITDNSSSSITQTEKQKMESSKITKSEIMQARLLESQLLKIDNTKTGDEASTKKDKKHTLHWKYEDPAVLLKDFLG
ncbi:uncharacterized protein I206_104578 [Kwoniella pini CBS 10737]|uniref:Transcriptional coactivator HFI1/ADA1 n=1 Tax=Kwoniella pini CBS 10737 TaxID=1296096 RepID=A0A1B9I7E8_9TREE|nr:uncharacterized protein I206_02113 [Kwoniella pini CBS 10737]OCF51399.1 hypothetical protein I206_02113 [Kwoniella pini CBS 10737]